MHRRPLAALVRRPLGGGLAAGSAVVPTVLLAVAALLVASPAPAVRAATSGWAGIVASTSCIPVDADPDTPETRGVTVDGHGFEPGSTVDIYVNVVGAESFPEPSDTRQVDDLGTFEGRISLYLPGDALTYLVSAVTRDADGPQAETRISSPCGPTLAVTPTCAAADSPFDISYVADGFSPGGNIYVGIIVPDGTDQIVSDLLTADDQGHLEYTMNGVRPLPAGRYQAVALEVAGSVDSAVIARSSRRFAGAQAPFELPCPRPKIALDPDCAPAGGPQDRYDVIVTGTGFRYGPAVITWDADGSNEEFRVDQVNDNGLFSVRIDPWQRPRGTRIKVVVTQTFPHDPAADEGDPLMGRYATEVYPRRVATTNFRVPCRPQATPVMTLDPDCDTPALVGDADRRYAIEVAASGLTPGPVDILFDAGAAAADVTPPEQFPGEVGKDGVLASVTITPLARPTGEYRVAIVQREQSIIERTFRVPCDKPTPVMRPLQPDCGPVTPGLAGSYSVRVRGRGFYPGAIAVVFDPQGTPDTLDTTVGTDGTFEVRIRATGRDAGEYTIVARQRDERGIVLRASRKFTVPCVAPTLTIEPASGPAGYTTLVTGADFPPGATVTLTWDRGITAATPLEATADAAGAFTVSIFLLPHDIPGPRVLTAGTPTDPGAFPDVTVDYLVTGGSGQPPGGPGDPGGIINRR